MTTLKSVHHINFIVADLDAAVQAYEDTLGIGPLEYEEIREREVATARVRVGEVWIVLVSPQRENSIAGRYLAAHGDGFFLMSFGVDNLDQAMVELARRGALPADRTAHAGLRDWRGADLETEDSVSVRGHLTQVD